jgi:hypothetical protein
MHRKLPKSQTAGNVTFTMWIITEDLIVSPTVSAPCTLQLSLHPETKAEIRGGPPVTGTVAHLSTDLGSGLLGSRFHDLRMNFKT